MARSSRRSQKQPVGPRLAILSINKPAGLTSRDVVNRVQRITGIRKCGHAGTLDPLATGVLVVCLNSATRLVPYIQKQQKSYRAEFRFGTRSTTDDIEGELTSVEGATFPTRDELDAALQKMTGDVEQRPPQFSAVKIDGRPAYKKARQGEQVELKSRIVRIDQLTLREFEAAEWKLDILCGSGTYVRSIGRDIGDHFGCGAIMTSLLRDRIGRFSLQDSVSLEELESDDWQKYCRPIADAADELPRRVCSAQEIRRISFGQTLDHNGTLDEEIALFDSEQRLIGIGKPTEDGRLRTPLVLLSLEEAATYA